MPRPRILTLVLAGGQGGRLELLTQERAKPAVPFGGTHRLIDFPLSNASNSGLTDVWVSQQFNPVSISDHVANGRPWDLDRTVGGLLPLQPRQGNDDRTGFHTGTADSLWHHAPLIREFAPDALVVLSADAVYRLNYADLVEEHLATDAAVTMVTTTVAADEAGRYGVVQTDGAGRITGYDLKPEHPTGNLISNEVFVFGPEALLDLVEGLANAAGPDGLEDLGHEVLPTLVKSGLAREHRFTGYWRDVGTVESYWEGHRDLLGADPAFDLTDGAWPIRTHSENPAAARVLAGARLENSLLSPGATIAGTVTGTVVGRGAVIEAGAVVRDCVLLPGSYVAADAVVERAVIDEGVRISRAARIGEDVGEISLVGLRSTVPEGTTLKAGTRYPADD